MSKQSKLEKALKRIKIITMLADGGFCDEYEGKIETECSMYGVDCPGTCTYAKSVRKKQYES